MNDSKKRVLACCGFALLLAACGAPAWANAVYPSGILWLDTAGPTKLWAGDTVDIQLKFTPDEWFFYAGPLTGFTADIVTPAAWQNPVGSHVDAISGSLSPAFNGWGTRVAGAPADFGPDGDMDWIGLSVAAGGQPGIPWVAGTPITVATIRWQADVVLGSTLVDIRDTAVVSARDFMGKSYLVETRLGPPVELWVVPEPVTMAGLMMGIGGLVTYIRKRRTA